MPDTNNALIPSISLDALLERRNAAAERISTMVQTYREVLALAEAMTGERPWGLRLETSQHRDILDHEEDLVKVLDAAVWSTLLDKSGLRSFLDATARDQWRHAIDKLQVPALTRENIDATFSTLHQGRSAMFERGVCELFRKLSWHYKTNSPCRLGKRLVLSFIVDTRIGSVRLAPRHDGCDRLDDLVRVMSILDHKPEPDHRHAVWSTLTKANWPNEGPFTWADYFSIRGFKNGNAHLTFLRLDLIDKMNAIIAKHYDHVLPPTND